MEPPINICTFIYGSGFWTLSWDLYVYKFPTRLSFSSFSPSIHPCLRSFSTVVYLVPSLKMSSTLVYSFMSALQSVPSSVFIRDQNRRFSSGHKIRSQQKSPSSPCLWLHVTQLTTYLLLLHLHPPGEWVTPTPGPGPLTPLRYSNV